MFSPAVYTRGWIERQRRQLGKCDPGLLEKCVHALTLLGHLAESGLPFLFKGGTSILLHLPDIRRLSIDIDIVSPAADAELDRTVARIGQTAPFIGCEENIRGTSTGRDPLPQRRHFQFFFNSERAPSGRANILLDVVQEEHCPHEIVKLPIRTSFLTPEREVLVQLPTIESLLGDKLTAFAPTTTGVKLRRSDGTEGDIMQVAKQLFDVGVLFEHANDFDAIARAYNGVQAQESSYRGGQYNRDASLTDSLNACLGITGYQLKGVPPNLFSDASLLLNGFRRLQGHLTQPLGADAHRTLASRAGLLALHLKSDQPLDFTNVRYTQSREQLDALRHATLNGHEHAWLDRLKLTNPEAYHYWYHGFRTL